MAAIDQPFHPERQWTWILAGAALVGYAMAELLITLGVAAFVGTGVAALTTEDGPRRARTCWTCAFLGCALGVGLYVVLAWLSVSAGASGSGDTHI
jgi:hypothetical protein